MEYLAKSKDGKSAIFLSVDVQMDMYLERNCNIYQRDDNGVEKLIATPEDGFLIERPVFPEKKNTGGADS